MSTGLQDSVWGGPEASPFRWKRRVHEQRKDRRLLNESPASTAAHENRRLSAQVDTSQSTAGAEHSSRGRALRTRRFLNIGSAINWCEKISVYKIGINDISLSRRTMG